MFDFTPDNAAELLKLLSPLVAVLATYLVTKVDMKGEWKIAIAFGVSLLVALLTAYSEGKLAQNFYSNLFYIFTAAQVVYAAVFKAAGLEALIKPREALASKAAHEVREQVAEISSTDAKALLDPNQPPMLDITTRVLNRTGDVS